ncbi:MAG: DUF262 domain-containing protein [Acidimicrobiales bacterium]|jgi:hypothetical protein|nr:DUF262 domain-containing protein [Acidimicrobiales bacterium]
MPDLRTEPVTVARLLQSDHLYWCPLFQRQYVWTTSKITTLFEDALTVDEGECESRFLGAVVFEAEEARIGYPTRFWLIDGQQRLTTLFLFLSALVEELHARGEVEKANSLTENYLTISAAGEMKNEAKFRPTVLDTKQFNVVLRKLQAPDVRLVGNAQGKETGKLKSGYDLARKLLRKRVADLEPEAATEWLWSFASCLLTGMRFVTITLGDDHDSNEVFDRLNSKAEPLKTIDLVRNAILKEAARDLSQAMTLHDEYWMPFHDAFLGDESAEQKYFFPLGLCRDSSIKKSQTFDLLSKRWRDIRRASQDQSPRELVRLAMNDLQEFQEAYCAVTLTGQLGPAGANLPAPDRKRVNLRVSRLHRLEASVVTMPYLMQLLNSIVDQSVPLEDGLDCIDVVESFLVRRAIMGIEPTGLHAVFKGLWDPDDLEAESLEQRMTTATVSFPSNQEFTDYVKTGRLYGRKIMHYVLWERELGFEDGDRHPQPIDFHAGHVIPRQLEKSDLDGWEGWGVDDWESMKNTWGNLVPLTPDANFQMGRLGWPAARELLNGNVIFKTTQRVVQDYLTWTPDDVRNRGDELAVWAAGRWKKLC